ncbi:MAG: hypothetical protein FRX49_09713 [Trebouxia sp. A1-2]|nr:MAG: hypothetical protein FRX49_09713 [Trebouxia sp. A1-2]
MTQAVITQAVASQANGSTQSHFRCKDLDLSPVLSVSIRGKTLHLTAEEVNLMPPRQFSALWTVYIHELGQCLLQLDDDKAGHVAERMMTLTVEGMRLIGRRLLCNPAAHKALITGSLAQGENTLLRLDGRFYTKILGLLELSAGQIVDLMHLRRLYLTKRGLLALQRKELVRSIADADSDHLVHPSDNCAKAAEVAVSLQENAFQDQQVLSSRQLALVMVHAYPYMPITEPFLDTLAANHGYPSNPAVASTAAPMVAEWRDFDVYSNHLHNTMFAAKERSPYIPLSRHVAPRPEGRPKTHVLTSDAPEVWEALHERQQIAINPRAALIVLHKGSQGQLVTNQGLRARASSLLIWAAVPGERSGGLWEEEVRMAGSGELRDGAAGSGKLGDGGSACCFSSSGRTGSAYSVASETSEAAEESVDDEEEEWSLQAEHLCQEISLAVAGCPLAGGSAVACLLLEGHTKKQQMLRADQGGPLGGPKHAVVVSEQQKMEQTVWRDSELTSEMRMSVEEGSRAVVEQQGVGRSPEYVEALLAAQHLLAAPHLLANAKCAPPDEALKAANTIIASVDSDSACSGPAADSAADSCLNVDSPGGASLDLGKSPWELLTAWLALLLANSKPPPSICVSGVCSVALKALRLEAESSPSALDLGMAPAVLSKPWIASFPDKEILLGWCEAQPLTGVSLGKSLLRDLSLSSGLDRLKMCPRSPEASQLAEGRFRGPADD